MVVENFQIYGVKITGKYICESKKIGSIYFYSCPQAKLYPRLLSPRRQKEITHFPRATYFESIFSPAERGEDYGTEKNDQNVFGFCFVVP